MSMQFTVSIEADFTQTQAAADVVSSYDVDTDMLDLSGDVSITGVSVSGSITIEGHVSVEGVEVSAAALADYDAEEALSDYTQYGISSVEFSNAEFEVTDSPTGFDTVVEALGYERDAAIAVYAALDAAGHEVS